MKLILATAIFCFTALSTSCSKEPVAQEEAPTAGASASTTESPAHAPAGAKPGSHEDWCAGHEVPESMCTRCNPKLSAAFKATGDWCQEHGLPESQCRICNPDIVIERPPKSGEQ